MKNDNYFAIQGWMINELHLKGNELLLYATIFGWNSKGQKYKASTSYIMQHLQISNKTVIRNMRKLLDKKLIVKELGNNGNVYTCVKSTWDKSTQDKSTQVCTSVPQPMSKCPSAYDKSTHNKYNNKYNNKLGKKVKKKGGGYDEFIETKDKLFKK